MSNNEAQRMKFSHGLFAFPRLLLGGVFGFLLGSLLNYAYDQDASPFALNSTNVWGMVIGAVLMVILPPAFA